MSKAGVMAVIEKALTDPKWVEQYRADPDAAFAHFDLTREETAALKTRNTSKLREIGIAVDERVQKGLTQN